MSGAGVLGVLGALGRGVGVGISTTGALLEPPPQPIKREITTNKVKTEALDGVLK